MDYQRNQAASRNLLELVRLMKAERVRSLDDKEEADFKKAKNQALQLDVLELVNLMLNNGPALAKILRSTR